MKLASAEGEPSWLIACAGHAGLDVRRFSKLTTGRQRTIDLMIAIMWQFDVKQGCEPEFEQLHGSDGEWTIMNRQTRSYLGSSFLRDQNRRSRYVVIEYWSEMLVYEEYRAYRSDAITSLERRRTMLVESVEPLGIFTALNVPDRTGPTWSQR